MVKGIKKNYEAPRRLETGNCFICLEQCPKEAYCHLDCAISYADAKEKNIIAAQLKTDKENEDTDQL